ncbi:carboxypeptidase-like regulatory domain-containing protein [Labilibaculum sp.]|uniref:carboxypeptidase-like regulatory domain-containing protein n=1 Tax=Labilibaculum sp. TaxID=2060723 RepID=UPI00356364DD
MYASKALISLLFLLYSTSLTIANDTDQKLNISISGTILQSKNHTPIPLATISINRTRQGTICDSLGVFHLQIQQGDTLRISALGFQGIDWEIPFIFNTEFPPVFQIKLEDTSYLLDEVDIYALGIWDEFKEEFIHIKVPKKDTLSTKFTLSKVEIQNIKDKITINTPPNLLGGLMYYASKLIVKKKAPQIVISKEIQELHKQILSKKYNKKLIAELTHEKGVKLDELTAFINSQTNFTFESNEFSIQTKIIELYEEFKQNPEIINKQRFKIDTSKKIINRLRL